MRLIAPEFTTSIQVDGHDYEADENGEVVVLNPDHAEQLKRLGFREPNAAAGDLASALAGSASAIAVGAALSDPAGAGAAALIAVYERYPSIAKALTAAEVALPDEVTAGELLDLLEEQIGATMERYAAFDGDGDGFPGGRPQEQASDDAPAAQEPAPAAEQQQEQAPAGDDAADEPASLYGSSVLPAIVEVHGYSIQLGGIVAAAFAEYDETLPSNLTEAAAVEAWNALEDADREAKLQSIVDQLTEDPAKVDELIPAPSIVGRPQQDGAEAAEATDPAEKPDFANMPHAELVAWLRAAPRNFTFKGNPSNAVAVQQAEEYWAAKHPAQ